jgi:hypothetical protein
MRLYLDTSVIGALFDTEIPQRQIVSPEEVIGYEE